MSPIMFELFLHCVLGNTQVYGLKFFFPTDHQQGVSTNEEYEKQSAAQHDNSTHSEDAEETASCSAACAAVVGVGTASHNISTKSGSVDRGIQPSSTAIRQTCEWQQVSRPLP